MKRSIKLRYIFLALAGLLILILAVNHRAFYQVFYNIFTPKITLDTSDVWQNGTSYIHIPYSEESESDYVDIYVPDQEETPPLYVIIHGGGFIFGDSQTEQAQYMYRYFRDHGYACASVNYRLAQEAPFPAAIADVKACIRYLRANADKYGYNGDKIAIFGESAGGYLACAAALSNDTEFNTVSFIGENSSEAASSEVQLLVDYYGALEFTGKESDWKESGLPLWIISLANTWENISELKGYKDFGSYWLRIPKDEMPSQYPQEASINSYIDENISQDSKLAVWIAQGNCDLIVPMQQNQRFYEKLSSILGQGKVHYEEYDKCGHAADTMYMEQELEKLKVFMDENLEE